MNGQQFHEALHRQAPWMEPHPEDEVHDQRVGEAVAAVRAGDIDGGIARYNEWAQQAGYAPVSAFQDAEGEVFVDIESCVLRIEPTGFQVMIWPVRTAERIDALLKVYEAPDWFAEDALDRGCRVWAFEGGAFVLEPLDKTTWQVHARLFPGNRYRHAVECGKVAVARELTAGNRLVVLTPKPNKRALYYALACGMRFLEENEKEWISCRLVL